MDTETPENILTGFDRPFSLFIVLTFVSPRSSKSLKKLPTTGKAAGGREDFFRTGELRFHGIRAEIMVAKTGEEKREKGKGGGRKKEEEVGHSRK